MLTNAALSAALPESFRLIDLIHSGGQRHVYEVVVEGERRVLKLMPELGRARAEREVAIGRRFNHPNLSKIVEDELQEIDIDGDSFVYFTEPLIPGETLAARSGVMEPCEAVRLASALISAVTYLWETHHVVHRDIKPLNIMATPTGEFVLLDIGVARHQELETLTVDAMAHQPGTLGYLAPEQLAPLKGREIDYRGDLFAIGIVVYEQLMGRLPFDPKSDSYRTLLTTGLVPELGGVPEALATFVLRLLAPRPHGRFRLDKANTTIAELGCS